MKKRNYLVAYDYGTGGAWAIIRASSKSEVLQKYPELRVYRWRPRFITKETYTKIAAALTIDIDDPPTGWIATMIKQR